MNDVCLIDRVFSPVDLLFLVPANEVHETNDGKTIRIEYREENGAIYKVGRSVKPQAYFHKQYFFSS